MTHLKDLRKVVTVAQQKGGAGKTTVAAQLAVAFSQKRFKVAAIDCDPQGSLTNWHEKREEWLGQGHTGIHFQSVSSWVLNSEIERLKEEHQIIVIDGPPQSECDVLWTIKVADLVVIPVQPSPTDVWATGPVIELARREDVPYRIVLNRVVSNSKMPKLIARDLPNQTEAILGNRVAFAKSIMFGQAVTETAPFSLAAEELRALTNEINSILVRQEKVIPFKEAV